jgi:hypothetical protein
MRELLTNLMYGVANSTLISFKMKQIYSKKIVIAKLIAIVLVKMLILLIIAWVKILIRISFMFYQI